MLLGHLKMPNLSSFEHEILIEVDFQTIIHDFTSTRTQHVHLLMLKRPFDRLTLFSSPVLVKFNICCT